MSSVKTAKGVAADRGAEREAKNEHSSQMQPTDDSWGRVFLEALAISVIAVAVIGGAAGGLVLVDTHLGGLAFDNPIVFWPVVVLAGATAIAAAIGIALMAFVALLYVFLVLLYIWPLVIILLLLILIFW